MVKPQYFVHVLTIDKKVTKIFKLGHTVKTMLLRKC